MPSGVSQLIAEGRREPSRCAVIVLLTSAVCLAGWNVAGHFDFWLGHLPRGGTVPVDSRVAAWIGALGTTVLLLGVVPLVVVKWILRTPVAEFGLRWGDLRFAAISTLITAPLLVVAGYVTSTMPAFQAMYPIYPPARDSDQLLLWHLGGQVLWYAAWEFHFRGFLQQGLSKFHGAPLGILVQTLASTLAHFGRPGSEVFASIAGGLLWGALVWRTRSILAGTVQHWLLGAALDFFLCRRGP